MSSSPEERTSGASKSKTHLDLFSGIGGFALAARWAGFRTVGFCELDPWCQKVLVKNFPGVPIHDDIRTLHQADPDGPVHDALRGRHGDTEDAVQTGGDGALYAGDIDLVTGGFPCQPVSVAGKRKGKEDDRWLWQEMARVVAEVRPRWVLGENTPGLVSMGLDDCLFDLESLGYEAWAVVVPACAVGAWHRRDRVWIVAHAERGGRGEPPRTDAAQGPLSEAEREEGPPRTGSDGADGPAPARDTGPIAELGGWWESEPGMGRVVTGIPRRVDRLRGLGNAIVPQVAYEFLRHME